MHEGGGSVSGWSEGGSSIWSTLGVPTLSVVYGNSDRIARTTFSLFFTVQLPQVGRSSQYPFQDHKRSS